MYFLRFSDKNDIKQKRAPSKKYKSQILLEAFSKHTPSKFSIDFLDDLRVTTSKINSAAKESWEKL